MNEMVRFYDEVISVYFIIYSDGNAYDVAVSEDEKYWRIVSSYGSFNDLVEDRPYVARHIFNRDLEDILS